ncbi:class II aldolase/adducin family protein [Mucisphaera sp.]|uniref:class II aldolase/adducin family protein n=1 Tax=Mucisphaera sp. TaxID=2913024 RepID=UPI003D0DCB63
MNQPLWQLKKHMCDIGHRIWHRGFCAGNEGNHSVRISEDRVLCTPTGISKGFLEPDDLCVVDLEGNQVEPNPKGRKRTSEVLVHLAIYKKQPKIKAVIHSHPPHAVAFCLANIPLPEGIHPEAEVFLGRTIFANYATPGGPDLPASFIERITEQTTTILMANHGSVSLGEDITDAYYKLEILDNYCKQLILAKQLGQVNVLNTQQMVELLKVKERFGFKDDRLSCATDGCVGVENEPFLTTFGVQPMSAHANDQGNVNHTPATVPINEAEFEQLVQSITNQIVAGNK